MAVNAEAMNLVGSLVHLHFELFEVCPAGVWGMPGCVEEAQPVHSTLPFPSQMTREAWTLSRIPLLPRGQLKGRRTRQSQAGDE